MRGGLLVLVAISVGVSVAACGSRPPVVAPPAPVPSAAPAAPAEGPPVPAGSIRRSSVRKILAAGPGTFLQRLELDDEPVFVKGRFHGFRIAALRGEPGLWVGVDLRPGDVVTRVNGKSVERPQDAFEVFHGLEVAPELRVDYERDGVPRVLTYPIVDD